MHARRFDTLHSILWPLNIARLILKDQKTPILRFSGNRVVKKHCNVGIDDLKQIRFYGIFSGQCDSWKSHFLPKDAEQGVLEGPKFSNLTIGNRGVKRIFPVCNFRGESHHRLKGHVLSPPTLGRATCETEAIEIAQAFSLNVTNHTL